MLQKVEATVEFAKMKPTNKAGTTLLDILKQFIVVQKNLNFVSDS